MSTTTNDDDDDDDDDRHDDNVYDDDYTDLLCHSALSKRLVVVAAKLFQWNPHKQQTEKSWEKCLSILNVITKLEQNNTKAKMNLINWFWFWSLSEPPMSWTSFTLWDYFNELGLTLGHSLIKFFGSSSAFCKYPIISYFCKWLMWDQWERVVPPCWQPEFEFEFKYQYIQI